MVFGLVFQSNNIIVFNNDHSFVLLWIHPDTLARHMPKEFFDIALLKDLKHHLAMVGKW
jgi:hypothetical protein